MRLIAVTAVLVAAGLAIFAVIDFSSVTQWALGQQRAFQNEIADAVHALQSGDGGALAALLVAAGAYGFVHAVGPGHGKYVIGGVGLGSDVSIRKLLSLAVASSLAQAFTAILLVYGGFLLFNITARQATSAAEDLLAPVSYLAISAIGAMLVWRGVRSLGKSNAPHGAHHDHVCASCGHAHGPSVDQVARVGSPRDAMLVIGSIAMRPCTGAVILLVIAWQMNALAAGAAAVVVMGLGTAALTSLVAVSSVAVRIAAFASAPSIGVVSNLAQAGQILAGAFIVWISMAMFLSGIV